MWLDQGAVRMIGEPDAVVDAFLEHVTEEIGSDDEAGGLGGRDVDKEISILGVWLADEFQHPQPRFDRGDAGLIDVTYSSSQAMPGAGLRIPIQAVPGRSPGGAPTNPHAVKSR